MEHKEALREMWETAGRELSNANSKIRAAGGKITTGDLDYLDKLTHMLKSVKTTLAMMEGGSNRMDYDSHYQGGAYEESERYVSPEYHESYRDSYNEGSYGRGRYAKRDSMGRYA